jgi:hypothetical protein
MRPKFKRHDSQPVSWRVSLGMGPLFTIALETATLGAWATHVVSFRPVTVAPRPVCRNPKETQQRSVSPGNSTGALWMKRLRWHSARSSCSDNHSPYTSTPQGASANPPTSSPSVDPPPTAAELLLEACPLGQCQKPAGAAEVEMEAVP